MPEFMQFLTGIILIVGLTWFSAFGSAPPLYMNCALGEKVDLRQIANSGETASTREAPLKSTQGGRCRRFESALVEGDSKPAESEYQRDARVNP